MALKSHGRNLVWVFEQLTKVRATSSRLEKEKLLDEIFKRDRDVLYDILYYTNHPFLNYHITVDDITCWQSTFHRADPTEAVWPRFIELLNDCNAGKISGNNARQKMESILSPLSETTRHWFHCIVNRDLKMGVAEKTVTKYFPDLLPDVKPMLAKSIDWNNCSGKVGWYLEPKYDGVRALLFVKDRKVTIVSRSGKPMWNTELIEEEILNLGVENAVFDCEFFAGTFAQTISIVHTQSKHPKRDWLKAFVFDLVPWSMWAKKETQEFTKRRALLEKVLGEQQSAHVRLVPSEPLKKAGHEIIEKHMQDLMREGFEGAVLKDPNAKYEWTRSTAWLKVKPVFEGDVKIVGFEKGTGKNANHLGAVLVEGEVEFFGKTYNIASRVGGGFSAKQRVEFWSDQAKKKGTIVQIEFKEVANWQKPQKVYALREPEFIRERLDK